MNSFTNTNDWKEFKLDDLFIISGTKTTPIEDLITIGKGIYPYVTTKAVNNGIDGYYDFYTELGGVLTIDSAVLGYCSYQETPFSSSDHVEKLIPKFNLNKYIALFLTTIINLENYRYSYGRKFNQKKIKSTTIKIPVTLNNQPDWEFM